MATVRSWRQMVLDADRDFILESTRPIAYEFSNGRKFRQPFDPYGLYATGPLPVTGPLTLDGETLTLDGEQLSLSDTDTVTPPPPPDPGSDSVTLDGDPLTLDGDPLTFSS